MVFDPFVHHRRSVRLRKHPYRCGIYFVTICADDRAEIFGRIWKGRMFMNAYGCVAHQCWQDISKHFSYITNDAFVVMPNHIHGILRFDPELNPVHITENNPTGRGMACHAPTGLDGVRRFGLLPSHSLCSVINSYKSAVTKQIHQLSRDAAPVWQRNYHEHRIRSSSSLEKIRWYIRQNPKNYH